MVYDGSGRLSAVADANPTYGNRRVLKLDYDGSSRINKITL